MLAYLAVFFAPLFAYLCRGNIKYKKTSFSYYLIIFIIWFFILGLRNMSIGSTDVLLYCKQFDNSKNYSFSQYLASRNGIEEVGYTIFVWVLSHLFPSSQWLIILCTILSSVALFNFVNKNSCNVVLSLAAYVTFLLIFNIQGLRQCLAMSICLFSFEYVKKRKLIPFLLTVLLAFLFHRTAIVFTVVYFVYGLKFSKINLLTFFIVSLIAVLLSTKLLEIANNVFVLVGIDRVYTGINDSNSGGYISLLIHLVIIMFSIFSIHNFEDCQENTAFLYLSIINLVCFSVRFFGAEIAERLSFYFCYFEFLLISSSLASYKNKEGILIKSLVFVLLLILFVYKIYNVDGIYPFKFYWE